MKKNRARVVPSTLNTFFERGRKGRSREVVAGEETRVETSGKRGEPGTARTNFRKGSGEGWCARGELTWKVKTKKLTLQRVLELAKVESSVVVSPVRKRDNENVSSTRWSLSRAPRAVHRQKILPPFSEWTFLRSYDPIHRG